MNSLGMIAQIKVIVKLSPFLMVKLRFREIPIVP